MMYNRLLETFIAAAEEGSFSKASGKLYISTNAVIKQTDLLEQQLKIKLFNRSHSGITLTPAGRWIYDNAKKIMQESDEILKKAYTFENEQEMKIRIGFSLMNSADPFIKILKKADKSIRNFQYEFISFEDKKDTFMHIIQNLGEDIDVIPCTYDCFLWDRYTKVLHLYDVPYSVGIPLNHPLAARKSLSVEDLFGKEIIVAVEHFSGSADDFLYMLREKYPEIHLLAVTEYEFDVFNQAVAENRLIMLNESMKAPHPFIANIPVRWEYRLPYGLLYSYHPSPQVKRFIQAIKSVQAM